MKPDDERELCWGCGGELKPFEDIFCKKCMRGQGKAKGECSIKDVDIEEAIDMTLRESDDYKTAREKLVKDGFVYHHTLEFILPVQVFYKTEDDGKLMIAKLYPRGHVEKEYVDKK